MAVSITDTRDLLRSFLLADTTLSGLVDGKIFAAHLSSADAQTVLQATPIVVFEVTSGFARYFRELENVIVELYTYSKGSAEEASQIYDLVFARLQSERVKVVGLGPVGIAREIERPIDGRNEEVGAWFVRSRWTLVAIAGPE